MATFPVYFWTSFAKKNNSTLTPTTGRTQYDCKILEGSGIINPTIQLNLGLSTDPSQYNYCHIPAFERYYYVDEWYFERGLWTASLSVDVLSTYKSQIGAASLYVLRASAASDGTIVDTMYPMKTGCSYQHNTDATGYTLGGGTYVVGCVSKYADAGSLNYYAMTATELGTLCSYLINSAVDTGNGFDLADASLALQTSLIDPIQYIKSCVFIPFGRSDFTTSHSTSGFPIFLWTVSGLDSYRIVLPAAGCKITKTYTLNITKHPSTTARGNYVNSAPYTLLTLYVPPFGVIEVDTSVTCNATQLDLELNVDVVTGKGILTVMCNGVILNRLVSMLGVPIQLSQVTRDYMGAITSVANGVASSLGSLASGNMAGAITGAISGIGNAVNAMRPREQSTGSGGGFAEVNIQNFQLDHQFFIPVNDDNTHHGRPYCQVTTPANLGGYMLIQDGDVAIPGTNAEAEQVRQYLESGFYYE